MVPTVWLMVAVICMTADTEGFVPNGPNQKYTGFVIHPNTQYDLVEGGMPLPQRHKQRYVVKYCHRSYIILSAKHDVSQGSIEVSVSPSLVSIRSCLHPDTYPQCSQKVSVEKKGTFFDCAKMAPFWLSWNNTGQVALGFGNVFGERVLLQHHANVDFKLFYFFYGMDGGGDGTFCFIYDLPPLVAESLALQVAEDAELGTVLHTFIHLRPKKVYGTQFYKQGADSSFVNITQTQLLLQRPLDYDSGKTSFSFYMFCENGSTGVNLTVIIDVIDVQDDIPTIRVRRGISLIEELPPGSHVGPWFLAYDGDKGDTLTYSLSGPDADVFTINESTGHMTTKGRIDREKTSLLTVYLRVKDKAGHASAAVLEVKVLNFNDNQPLFKKHLHRMHLPMSHRDENLAMFHVTDGDEGPGMCHCFLNITNGNIDNVFRLEGVRLKTNLEMLMDLHVLKNKDFQHLITITATDRPQRGPPLSTTAYVFLTVEKPRDYKESAPAVEYHFTSAQHPRGVKRMHISVAEDATGVVYTVAVPMSDDISLATGHQQLHFKSDTVCPDGKGAKEHFQLNAMTGELAVARPLNADHGGCTVFILTIYIADYRKLTEMTFMHLNVTVTNANDNPPISKPPWVLTRLPCHFKPGHVIADFVVSDGDIGVNNIKGKQISKTMFKYKMEIGSKGLRLIIDRGEKPWTKPFRQDLVKFQLTDSGDPPLSAVIFAGIQGADCSKGRRRRAAMSAVTILDTRVTDNVNAGGIMVHETTAGPSEHSKSPANGSISTVNTSPDPLSAADNLDFGGEMTTRSANVEYASTSSTGNVEADIASGSASIEPDRVSSLGNVQLDSTSRSTNVEPYSASSSGYVETDSELSSVNVEVNSVPKMAYVKFESVSNWDNVELDTASSSNHVEPDSALIFANVEPDSTSNSANIETDSTSSSANVETDSMSSLANVETDSTSSSANVETDSTSRSANVETDSTSSSANVETDSMSSSANIQADSTSSSANVETDSTSSSADVKIDRTSSSAYVKTDSTSSSGNNVETDRTPNSANVTTVNSTNLTDVNTENTTNSANVGDAHSSTNVGSSDGLKSESMASLMDLGQSVHDSAWSSTTTLMTAESPPADADTGVRGGNVQGQKANDCFSGKEVIILLLLGLSLLINAVLGAITFALHLEKTEVPYNLYS